MNNTSKVFKEEINVSDSKKFVTVKEAAVELQLKVGQIKHLITQELIDHKLENGTSVVDVNSIDESVMIDLKKRENVYPKRQDYKLKSNKTIDKKIVINSIINNMNNSTDAISAEYKRDFERICDSYGINYNNSKIQSFIHKIISSYYTNKKNNLASIFAGGIYTMIIMGKEDNKFEYGFYFLHTKKIFGLMHSITDTDEYSKQFIEDTIDEYVFEKHLFYLTLDELIKEFSPPEHYEKNKIWSLYLDPTEYVAEEASNDEDISRSPMELHKVNGYWRNQPYGSRKNPRYERIWVDDFARGGKKVKMAA